MACRSRVLGTKTTQKSTFFKTGVSLGRPGLENSTRPLVFTSASGCRASENFDISSENYIFSLICQ